MARVPGKGTIFELTISTSLTAIPQIVSISHSGAGAQLVATPALDSGIGIPYTATGYTEGGSYDLELYYDPAETDHQFITDMLVAPDGSDVPNSARITFADTGATTATFNVAGVTDYGYSVVTDDLVRATCTLKLDGMAAYPT